MVAARCHLRRLRAGLAFSQDVNLGIGLQQGEDVGARERFVVDNQRADRNQAAVLFAAGIVSTPAPPPFRSSTLLPAPYSVTSRPRVLAKPTPVRSLLATESAGPSL